MRFKFRAECYADVEKLLAVFPRYKIDFLDIFPEQGFLDVEVIMDLPDSLTLEDIRNFMRLVEDGHVMVETVQPEEKYTGNREDYWREQYPRNSELN